MPNQPEINLKTIFNEFWKGLKPQKKLFFFCVFAFTAAELIEIIIPVFYKHFFDSIGQPGTTGAELIDIILFIAGFHGLIWLFSNAAHFSLASFEARSMARLKQNAFDYMIGHSRGFFVNNFAGSLVQRVNRFARSFETLMDILVFNIIPLAVTVIGAIAVTAFIAPVISLIIIAWTSLAFVSIYFFSRWKLKYDIGVAAADSKTTGLLSDDIINYSSIKLFNGFKNESQKFKEVSDRQADKVLFSWWLSNSVNAAQNFLIFLVEFFAFYYAIMLWQDGRAAIGTFVLIQTYIIGIAYQLWGINRMFRGIYQSLADSKEMVEILALPHEIKDLIMAKNLAHVRGEIEYKDVTFSFSGTRNVLNDINLKIKAGEKIALVGPSGTGKTTLTGLLLRLFEPTSGEIYIDGQNIRHITLESLRGCISLVPQDPILFHRSIMENIRYGKPDATDEEVIAAGKLAHCDEFINFMPIKYETLVGERGVKLSGGERQRIAIARAILKKAPILILDEATSSLDSHSEGLIQDAFDTLMKNCTTIAVAHRLSTIRKMDRIIVMDNGAIAEQGGHDHLLRKKNGIYRQLWNLQSGGFIE